MRRGHPTGIGGWRNENPRGFRPRGVGTPSFRPTRPYALLDIPRYQPSRPYKDYNVRPGTVEDHNRTDRYNRDHDKNKFRLDNRQNMQNRHQDRGHQRHNYYPHVRQPVSNNTYGEISHYYENTTINSMGDVDHRQSYINPNQEQKHYINPWFNTPIENKKHYDDKNENYKHDVNENNKMPLVDYTGHRPPASDHYDGNPGPALDNSNTFSRSVDDTVNIVRKRLLSRNESQQPTCDETLDQNQEKDKDERVKTELCPSVQQEQPIKKKMQRQRQNIQSNCAKIKTKIVHQLFKMDKDKIHKLMDNPNSSTKFEYAISSLITESQNSYNRHLRSVAEKSLSSSSTEFMQNDNNTIYEDTFMKQMQCILDPQDSVLLEDIKPMVMAELSKVLQLDNFLPDDQTFYQSRDEQPNYDEYKSYDKHSQSSTYYPQENSDHFEENLSQVTRDNLCIPSEILTSNNEINKSYEYNKQMQYDDTKPLFERRPIKKSNSYSEERRISSERRHSRRSLDNKTIDENFSNEIQVPLFDSNAEQFSDEEDPFAELDKQYHVAVDHNFIESDYLVSQPSSSKSPSVTSDASNKVNTPEKQIYGIKNDDRSQQPTATTKSLIAERNTYRATQSKVDKEIDSRLRNIAKSPIKVSLGSYKNSHEEQQNSRNVENLIKQESTDSCITEEKETYTNVVAEAKGNEGNDLDKIKQESIPECKDNNDINDKSENLTSITKSVVSCNSRKRSIDQRPSHRKEKRKKSESCQMETNKQILNKNIIINLSDCAANSSEKCDAPKSIFNLFFSKDDNNKEMSKDNKSSDLDKGYSDKYVKRKESPKKIKETEIKRKRSSNSFSNSAVSPKINNVTNLNIQTPSKAESKAKLKTIDMFLQQPKKINLHQAHRNTVLMPSIHNKSEENKPKLSSTTNKLLRRHVATQVIKKYQTKDTQTIQTRKVMRAVQTDPVTYLKTEITSTDPFERMKEIDFEIQLLLQEKFKLYNSMESKDSCPNTMQNLGMTVLNFDATKDSETTTSTAFSGDAIAEDFTNIPVEELEQIAFEAVDDAPVTPKLERRSRRQKKILQQDRKSSVSPITAAKRNTRNSKTPNISLIEQIITDDRPLEDIISLDDLEAPIIKTKKKPQKRIQKKKVSKKTKNVTSLNIKDIKLMPCSVVILRENFEKYLQSMPQVLQSIPQVLQSIPEEVSLDEPLPTNIEILKSEPEIIEMNKNIVEEKDIVEEVVTDMQFDMLDVSEDIVIGDNCEDKLVEEKDAGDRIEVPINEEIILDNSQSSAEDGLADATHNSIMCRTFDYSGDENLRRDSVLVTGNADAVLAIECIENNFIAACLDGNVYYFSGDGQLISTLRGSNLAVTCLTIVKEKYGTTVYTGSLDSRIRYYDLETGLEKGPECNVLSPIQTMDRAWDTVFVGTRTGFVLQFECKNNMLIPVSTVKFSEQSILALRAMKEGPRKVLLVAARSENVTVKDAQTGLLLRILSGPKMTVYTLLYEDGKVYCGTSSHQIHVFDYTSGGHVGTHEGGKGAVCLRAAGGLLFAGCYDGCVYVYREGEGRPFAQLRGPGLMLLSLAIVGTKIIAGYKDRSLYIWKIPLSILQEMIL